MTIAFIFFYFLFMTMAYVMLVDIKDGWHPRLIGCAALLWPITLSLTLLYVFGGMLVIVPKAIYYAIIKGKEYNPNA